MPVFGVSQHDANQEGAERHRQANRLHDKRRADDQKQGGGGEDLVRASQRDDAESGGQQIPADQNDPHDRADRLGDRQPPAGRLAFRARGQERHHGKERHNGEILKQQDRESGCPIRGVKRAPLFQDLKSECRRRQGKPRSRNKRRWKAQTGEHQDAREQRSGDHHLGEAEPENLAPHDPEPLWAQLQTNDE